MKQVVQVPYRPGLSDCVRDHIRVGIGLQPFFDWEWNQKPEEKKPIVHPGKQSHFLDPFYGARTTTRKRSRPDINSVTKIERYSPKLVLVTDDAPVDRPKQTFKSVKKVAKKKVPETVENEEQTTTTIEEME